VQASVSHATSDVLLSETLFAAFPRHSVAISTAAWRKFRSCSR